MILVWSLSTEVAGLQLIGPAPLPRREIPLNISASGGGMAAGVIHNLNLGRVGVRSAYLRQVEQIAPPQLLDRDGELRELVAFCIEPARGPYVWWRAPAWAGKSALLSTFVLHPPAEDGERVRLVSFFITARQAGQDTRDAFTQVVLEQLADVLNQDVPALTATLEAHLREMLDQAAHACQEAGVRLVLVVDGLDEDRGVTTGRRHSIAALLPAEPPAGMRIIVAGRPDPPIPKDVPAGHPLRDPRIVRLLAVSPHAQKVKDFAVEELERLLHGTDLEQDMLGLLTAARGGLSGPDLAELTGASLWELEEILHGVAGRTFTRRASRWQSETGQHVYLLGHEELQIAAERELGEARLAGYRDRLHAWAGTYRKRGWPVGSPEYLLSGYYRLLTALGDLPRLVAAATDTARHDRMLDLTGGDAAALTETRAVLELIASHDEPNLAAALRVAYHRDQLTARNMEIPAELPALWARLGQPDRAEALARSITDRGMGGPEPSGLRTSSKVHPERVGCKWPARKRTSRLSSVTRLPGRLWIIHGPLPRWRAESA